MTSVDFYFDSICPFAWATSRWVLEVEKVRDVEVTFKVMSLSVLNDGRELDAHYMELMEGAWGPARVAIAVEQRHGSDGVRSYYNTIGNLHHVDKRPIRQKLVEQVLADAGLDADLIDAYEDESYDDALSKSHHRGMDPVGYEVGTPVMHFDGTAYFGPVITRIPKGEEAGELWDAVHTMGKFDYFFELKRTRTEDPQAE